jgi:hypothetical protein
MCLPGARSALGGLITEQLGVAGSGEWS